MSIHTFYVPRAQWGDHCILDGGEARHLHVLRLTTGTEIRLLDGEGGEGLFRLERIGKKQAELRLIRQKQHPLPQSLPIMALAWSKATRRGFFMEKAVELGVHEVWLWQGDHSQGRVPPDVKESWQGQMIAGVKQCGNPWLPAVRVMPGGIEELIATSATADHRILPWEQQENVPVMTLEQTGLQGVSVYVIGPEGGFSPRELDALHTADFKAVSFGSQILRCETAALLCLGIHWWGAHVHGFAGKTPQEGIASGQAHAAQALTGNDANDAATDANNAPATTLSGSTPWP